MKRECIFCNNKMYYQTKIKRKGLKFIVHRLDYCKNCNFKSQSTSIIPDDLIKDLLCKLEDIKDFIVENIYTTILLIIISMITLYSIILYVPSLSVSKLDNISNTLLPIIIQSNISIIGLVIVAITLSWNRAENDLSKLADIRNKAIDILCGAECTPDNTILEKAIDEYYYYNKESHDYPIFNPERSFLLFGLLLLTVNYYRQSFCGIITRYSMVDEFIKDKISSKTPLFSDYRFFKCIQELNNTLYNFQHKTNMKEIYDNYKILNREHKIDFKLHVIQFNNNLTGILFKCYLLSLFINTMLSVFLLLSPVFSYKIFDLIIIIFSLSLSMIFKLILNIIETI